MRRGAGLSALSRHTDTNSSFNALSSTLTAKQLESLQVSLERFRQSLQQFASAHRKDIRADPAFRHQFQKMCSAIGVDPLGSFSGGGGSTSKAGGWWQEVLGLGEWQYELAVQVVDICVSTRPLNGGIIEMKDLVGRVQRLRGGGTITPEDVVRSLDVLKPLQSYTVVETPHATYVRSVAKELDTDQSMLLALAADTGGRLSIASVKRATRWTEDRIRLCLDDCVMREGLGWLDENGDVWIIAAVDFADG